MGVGLLVCPAQCRCCPPSITVTPACQPHALPRPLTVDGMKHLDDELLDGLNAISNMENLPLPRKGELRRRLIFARSSADRQKIIRDAATESARNAYRTKAEFGRLYGERADYARLMEQRAASAPQKPSAAPTASRRYAERHPDPKPVTTRYVEPRKPAPIQEVAPKVEPVPAPVPEAIEHTEKKNLKHGIPGYKAGCRCEECREAKKRSRTPVGRVRRANGEPAPHGTTTNYSRGCRCQECKDAVATYARLKRNQENA